jgi:hypothetical protein
VPVVLNVNGHFRGGKAMTFKQARCINQAKRGMLALNTEFVGMGELQASVNHMDQGHIDLCGVAGVGVMYLAMKRGLDVLLAHKNADPKRVAMTGLSGGGWQTALLSAVDERITATMPVSGHSPIWHRALKRWADLGDLEQTPTDQCTVADFDTLTAMFAPRHALLVHSDKDGIFRPEFMRPALYQPARKVYQTLGVEDRIGFYTNTDPGTHNFDKDIREQLYKFLKKAWSLDISTDDLPCDDEIYNEWDLTVGLPTDNPTFISIATSLAATLPKKRSSKSTLQDDRRRLADILRLPKLFAVTVPSAAKSKRLSGTAITHHVLQVGLWPVPVIEFNPDDATIPTLFVADGQRGIEAEAVQALVAEGRRVFVADVFDCGEQRLGPPERAFLFSECVATAGDRPLGICTAQMLALVDWIAKRIRQKSSASRASSVPRISSPCIDVVAHGLGTGLAALCAAALKPQGFNLLKVDLPDTLRRIIDWRVTYQQAPMVFCFGLLEQFDIPDLLLLSDPVQVEMTSRGPMR